MKRPNLPARPSFVDFLEPPSKTDAPVVARGEPAPEGEPHEEVHARPEGEPRSEATPTVESSREPGLLHYLAVSLSGAVLILVAALAAVVIVLPFAVGGQALTVLTQSMEPGLPPGTLIVIRPQSVDDIRVGDVLTYQIESGQAAVVSHRVTSKAIGSDGSTTFLTKGDNNDLADPEPVQEVQVRGTLWYSVPYLGYVNNAVNGEARAFVVPIAAGALFLYALWMFVSGIRDRRKARSAT